MANIARGVQESKLAVDYASVVSSERVQWQGYSHRGAISLILKETTALSADEGVVFCGDLSNSAGLVQRG